MDADKGMPEVVAAAVNQMMREVKTLLRSERNRDAEHRFASIGIPPAPRVTDCNS